MGRSILAVIAGFITMILLDGLGGSIIKSALPAQPPASVPAPASTMLFSILLINTLISSAGAGYVCATIARVAALAHAGALAAIVVVIRFALVLTHRDLPGAVLLQDVAFAGVAGIAILLGARMQRFLKERVAGVSLLPKTSPELR
jgi:hypothetical protein